MSALARVLAVLAVAVVLPLVVARWYRSSRTQVHSVTHRR
jgi:preprotein translocase subunit Sec63